MEEVVMQYLACQGLFISPQCSVQTADGREWCCPDCVALDIPKREVQVVEVTTAWDVSKLLGKVRDREQQWLTPVREYLRRRGVIDHDWTFVVRLFVRSDRADVFEREFRDVDNVIVQRVEDIAFSWRWPWKEWAKGPNPPVQPTGDEAACG